MTSPAPHFRIIPTAFVVAYANSRGELVPKVETMTYEAALAACTRLNAEKQAEDNQVKQLLAARFDLTPQSRAGVRYFEPDQFA